MPTITGVVDVLVKGDRDQSHPIDVTGRKTAQLIRGSQLKVYKGAVHSLFITHKEQFNRDLLAFVEDNSSVSIAGLTQGTFERTDA